MKVFILFSNWMCNGDSAVNEVIGVYDCLAKAQQVLVSCVYSDLTSKEYDDIWADSLRPVETYDIQGLANMFYDDSNFDFPVRVLKIWNGSNDSYCEDYQTYQIVEREVL